MVELVTSSYTSVLFELALEYGMPEKIGEQLHAISEIMRQNPQYMVFLTGPQIPREDKIASIETVFGGKVEDPVKNFLKVLVDNKRFDHLPSIADHYKKLLREHLGIAYVEAVTAVEMSEDQKKRLVDRLGSKLGQKVELTNVVDPSIIGGMKVRIGERSLDASIGSRLADLRAELEK
ncbi:MAG: ATP synthase F1 subunit delta [Peptostreptococcaceae bacterium]|nr:ATP synthase F1 subunit delta [Peptostreptococcaceae bacterium]